MIEINLSPAEKQSDLTNIGGINISLLKPGLVFFGLILVFAIEPAIDNFYVEEILKLERISTKISAEVKVLSSELGSYSGVKKQIEELKEQELELASKMKVVKGIVDKRQNPFKILKYISDNTPKDIWITNLEITGTKFTLTGYSISWMSIGTFIENLRSSIFFDGNIKYKKPTEEKKMIGGARVESFVITTSVMEFK